jgi:phenylacetate-CoA oxygenase PaaI subunit
MGGNGPLSPRFQSLGAKDVTGNEIADPALAVPGLSGLIASLADNKYFLGQRYAEWCTAAPTLESAVAAASMAQDEIGHARSFYPLLRDVAGSSPEVEPETRTAFINVPFLGAEFAGWTDFVAANLVFDTALTVLLESAQRSTFGPLAQRARRILQEEPLHWLHAEGWTRRLTRHGRAVRDALASSIGLVAPQSLAWFDVAGRELVRDGIVDRHPDEQRIILRDRINEVLHQTDSPLI